MLLLLLLLVVVVLLLLLLMLVLPLPENYNMMTALNHPIFEVSISENSMDVSKGFLAEKVTFVLNVLWTKTRKNNDPYPNYTVFLETYFLKVQYPK